MTEKIDGIDYGPLTKLLGKWVGQKGTDIAPDNQAQIDESPFSDELTFSVAGFTENAEEQQLVAIKYHHVVRKNENGLIFHDQIGHWIYEASTGLIMHSLSIPRGVSLLAGGSCTEEKGKTIFSVEAKAGSETFGIVQSPFMLEKAKTTAFEMHMTLSDNVLHYREITSLFIYGKAFEHTDESSLQRVVYDLG